MKIQASENVSAHASAGMEHPLQAGLDRPPGGHLRLVAHFNHTLVVRKFRKWRRTAKANDGRIDVTLRVANVIADLKIG